MIRRLLFIVLLCSAINESYSQTHVYQFNGVLTGTGGAPTLTEIFDATCTPAGLPGGFASEVVTTSAGVGPSQQVFTHTQNGGLSYSNASFITGTYTIHILFRVHDFASGNFSFQKLLDFTNLTSDNGLYTSNHFGPNQLYYVNCPTCPNAIGPALNIDQYYLVSLTRDGVTKKLNIYIDGVNVLLDYDDTPGDFATGATNPITLFRDDNATTCESGAGAIRYLSVTNGVADATSVQTTWLILSAAVLPINLTTFTAQKNSNSIAVQWQTSSEVNAAYYNVERSYDGQTFASIASVNAKNASSNSYTYNDLSGISLTNSYTYYRLKSVDVNGNFKYSSIVKVANGKETKVTVFPNPATNFVTISGLNSKDEIRLLSIDGKVLSQQTNTGAQSMVMSIEKYKPGTYIIQVKNDTEVSQQKFVKY